jgi:hypothetical protein
MRLAVVVPTRSRPQAVAPLVAAFADTCTADTWLILAVDGCERVEDYRQAYWDGLRTYPRLLFRAGPRRRLVGTLNFYANRLVTSIIPPEAIGYMGDDHRPATPGWDSAYLATLTALGTGIVYGDDLVQGANLPTQMAMTTDIVAALGYVAPPGLVHMYCDNFWKDLGEGAGCLTHLPEVTVAHHHPSTGRASWDASYRESNAADRYAADKAAYEKFRAEQLDADIKKVRDLRV